MRRMRRGQFDMRGKKRRVKLSFIKSTKAIKSPIQRKLKQLQRIIPGCHEKMDTETLFRRTENYIFLLEFQGLDVRILESHKRVTLPLSLAKFPPQGINALELSSKSRGVYH
ncbi:hypothetical protein L1049_022025 [Liquidambar formosana]|uniref:Uncharacterized protein n=1 Tax=Liquidambar formosana TaxID=63359 RepID=A0AAP0RBX1_LIQFO